MRNPLVLNEIQKSTTMKSTPSPTPQQASFLNRLSVMPEREAMLTMASLAPVQLESLAACCGIDPTSPTCGTEIATYARNLFAKYLCHA